MAASSKSQGTRNFKRSVDFFRKAMLEPIVMYALTRAPTWYKYLSNAAQRKKGRPVRLNKALHLAE